MKRTFRALSLFPILILVFFTACRSDLPETEENVYIHSPQDPERLNPILYPYAYARPINSLIFLPLADYNPVSLDYEAVMIKEVPVREQYNEEGSKFTFEILDEAVWDDGREITAEDYLFTIKVGLHPLTAAKSFRSVLPNISKIETFPDNNKRIAVYFDEDYALALETATNFEILPRHIYDSLNLTTAIPIDSFMNQAWIDNTLMKDSVLIRWAEEINSQTYSREIVSGSGPYALSTWIPEEAVVLSRKKDYWGAKKTSHSLKQGPSQIIYKIIVDENTAIAQMKAGLIDLMYDVSSLAYSAFQKDSTSAGKFNFDEMTMMRYYFLVVNNENEMLSSRSVRKALAHVTPVDRYIELFENGFAQRTISFINPQKFNYHTGLKPIPYDIETAKKILENDGWKDTNNNGVRDKVIDGKRVELIIQYHASGQLGTDIGLLLKESAAAAGMNIQIIQQDYSITRKENLATGNYGLIASALNQDISLDDPYSRFHSDNARPGGSNSSMYKSPEADSLIALINTTSDKEELKTLYFKLQEVIYEDQPTIFLYVPKTRFIRSKKWEGPLSLKRPGFFPNTFQLTGAAVRN